MNTSEQGLALIKRCEGFSAEAYFCPAGRPTIGYGHVIGAWELFPRAGIDKREADMLLKEDVGRAEVAIYRHVTAALTQNQYDALVSLIYNIGVEAFEKSTLLRLLNNGDLAGAAQEFGRWIYARGKKLDGLAARRAQEMALFQEV